MKPAAYVPVLLAIVASPASAISPLTEIDQIYSNADGSVQFIVALDGGMTDCDSGEAAWAGRRLTSNGPGGQKIYVFPNDLPTCMTSGRRILIATEGFAALGLVTPDFVIPNDFLQRPAGSVAISTVAALSYTNLPTDGVRALDGFGLLVLQNRATNLAGASASVVPSVAVELNQHGLTGTWYEAATGGQGIGVEVFADRSSGTGLVFLSWFTYDTMSGGAERQRWYTAQGPVTNGQPNAALTLYQNVGGNFDAPPVTGAQAVGTATLSFASCSSGQFSYTFTDGSGRSGTIPLTRLTQNVTCSTTSTYPTDPDFALSGNWFSAATSGQGFTVEANAGSGVFFVAWYTYMPNGTAAGAAGQRWYTAQSTFAAGARSIPVTLYETTGGVFDTPTPPGQTTVPVGTGTMVFQSCAAATLSYAFTGGSSTGRSGTVTLIRVGPVPPGCTQ